ncbi:MAG: hypothetical protein V3V20_07765 [Algisphaera sp.]
MSRLAVVALLGNVLVVVPGVPALMAILGLKARGDIKQSPLLMRGIPVAWVAVMLGVVLTLAQAGAGYVAYKQFDMSRRGAALALSHGLSGNVESFVDAFTDEGERVQREIAAEVFLGEASLRFGDLASVRPVSAGVWSPENLRMLLIDGKQEFQLNFEHGRVRMRVMLAERGLNPRLGLVQLIDPERGTMTFPGASQVADHPGF